MSDFNPFAHDREIVWSNVSGAPLFGGTPSPTLTLPDGQVVPTAIANHMETKEYWLGDGPGGTFREITHDQSFVQNLYLHYVYGMTLGSEMTAGVFVMQGLAEPYNLSLQAMRDAVMGLPVVLNAIVSAGITEAEVWAYTQAEAPWAVDLVGVTP